MIIGYKYLRVYRTKSLAKWKELCRLNCYITTTITTINVVVSGLYDNHISALIKCLFMYWGGRLFYWNISGDEWSYTWTTCFYQELRNISSNSKSSELFENLEETFPHDHMQSDVFIRFKPTQQSVPYRERLKNEHGYTKKERHHIVY